MTNSTLTNADFARLAANLSSICANGSSDALMLHDELGKPVATAGLSRFLQEARAKLDYMQERAGLPPEAARQPAPPAAAAAEDAATWARIARCFASDVVDLPHLTPRGLAAEMLKQMADTIEALLAEWTEGRAEGGASVAAVPAVSPPGLDPREVAERRDYVSPEAQAQRDTAAVLAKHRDKLSEAMHGIHADIRAEARRAALEEAARIADAYAERKRQAAEKREAAGKPFSVAECKEDAGISIAVAIREAAR